ncbi:hypothetical protein CDL15_Pgr028054 [Punica granatum]|uniref:Uncharacterized protein n=1 Tax=Punica granatum TaxID=22663 RepID=A0A218XJY2_PUNGR|nr:hypothetical protein CDL15_Pgr028054 [Punica granatum]
MASVFDLGGGGTGCAQSEPDASVKVVGFRVFVGLVVERINEKKSKDKRGVT